MTQLTIDNQTAAKLFEVREKIELRDEKGRIVGHFSPGPPRDENGQIITPFTDEEVLESLGKERGQGRSWAEIKRDLEAM